jgi:hypothetical protein
MNGKSKELLNRLLSLRNVIPVLIIGVAFIGTFVPNPLGLQRDQLILGLLAFLAIDALIERIELLTNIEKDVGTLKESKELLKDLKEMITDPFLKKTDHKDLRIESYSEGAKELFFVGASCNTLLTIQTSFMEEWIRQGNSLKFLLLNPKRKWLEDVILPVINYKYDLFREEINQALEKIKYLRSLPNAKVEVRLFSVSPTQGIVIVNGGEYLNALSKMIVHLYLPNDVLSTRPCFILSKVNHEKWFNRFHKGYYEELWNSSMPYEN